jgi:hypothetical protein
MRTSRGCACSEVARPSTCRRHAVDVHARVIVTVAAAADFPLQPHAACAISIRCVLSNTVSYKPHLHAYRYRVPALPSLMLPAHSLVIRATGREVPVYLQDSVLDFKCCTFGHTYQACRLGIMLDAAEPSIKAGSLNSCPASRICHSCDAVMAHCIGSRVLSSGNESSGKRVQLIVCGTAPETPR